MRRGCSRAATFREASVRCASVLKFLSASKTRARPITVRPWMFFKSELTVSAMPVPIQSSVASRVMLTNVMTATELSIRCCGAAAMRDVRRGTESSDAATTLRSACISFADG